jgi:hypothetical protein
MIEPTNNSTSETETDTKASHLTWETATPEQKNAAEELYQQYREAVHGAAVRPTAFVCDGTKISVVKTMLKGMHGLPEPIAGAVDKVDEVYAEVMQDPTRYYVQDGKVVAASTSTDVPAACSTSTFMKVATMAPTVDAMHEFHRLQYINDINKNPRTADKYLNTAAYFINSSNPTSGKGEEVYAYYRQLPNPLNFSGGALPEWDNNMGGIGDVPRCGWNSVAQSLPDLRVLAAKNAEAAEFAAKTAILDEQLAGATENLLGTAVSATASASTSNFFAASTAKTQVEPPATSVASPSIPSLS